MKKYKKTIEVAALLIATFGFSAVGYAEEIKEGMSLADMKLLVPKFSAVLDGRTLRFAGGIPRACITGDKESVKSEYKNGKHFVTIHLSEKCEKKDAHKELKGKDTVPLSQEFPAIQLADKPGEVFLAYVVRETEDPLLGVKRESDSLGVKVEASAQVLLREKARALDEVSKNLMGLCDSGNFEGLGAELEKQSSQLGDLKDKLKVESARIRLVLIEKKLEKALIAEDAKQIFDDLVENGAAQGIGDAEMERLTKKYIERRNKIAAGEVASTKDGKTSIEKAAGGLRSWRKELETLDSQRAEDLKLKFAAEFKNLGDAAADRDSYRLAGDLYNEAADIAGNSVAANDIRSKAVGLQLKAAEDSFEQCLRKNPNNAQSCAKKLEADKGRAKKMAENVAKNMKRIAKDEESKADAAAAASEVWSVFGGFGGAQGMYGYQPGSFDANIQQLTQRVIMENYQAQMMQQWGMAGPAAASSRFSYSK